MKEVGLIVNEEISQLVGLFLKILLKQYADSIVYTVHFVRAIKICWYLVLKLY